MTAQTLEQTIADLESELKTERARRTAAEHLASEGSTVEQAIAAAARDRDAATSAEIEDLRRRIEQTVRERTHDVGELLAISTRHNHLRRRENLDALAPQQHTQLTNALAEAARDLTSRGLRVSWGND